MTRQPWRITYTDRRGIARERLAWAVTPLEAVRRVLTAAKLQYRYTAFRVERA